MTMTRIAPHRNLLIAALMFGLSAPFYSQADASDGFDLPIVDLDAREDLRTVVDREKGRYLGHPTTLLMQDGRTILCVYPKGHGRGAVVYKRSEDGGKTWSDRLPTPKSCWPTPTSNRTTRGQACSQKMCLTGSRSSRRTMTFSCSFATAIRSFYATGRQMHCLRSRRAASACVTCGRGPQGIATFEYPN